MGQNYDMGQNPGDITAILTIEGETGGVKVVQGMVQALLGNKRSPGSRVQTNFQTKQVIIHGPGIERPQLEAMAGKSKVPFQIDYREPKPALGSESREATGLPPNNTAELDRLYIEMDRLYRIVAGQTDRITEQAETEQGLRNALRDSGKKLAILEEQAVKARSDEAYFFDRNIELEESVAALQKAQGTHVEDKDMYSLMLHFFEQISGKIKRADTILGDDIYQMERPSLDEVLERVNLLGLPEAHSKQDLLQLGEEYNGTSKEKKKLEELFDGRNKERFRDYNHRQVRVKAEEAVLTQISSFEEILGKERADDLRDPAKSHIEEDTAVIETYLEDRSNFVQIAVSVLAESELYVKREERYAEISESLRNLLERGAIPILIHMSETNEIYGIDVHFPLKSGQKSKIFDLVMCENVFTAAVLENVEHVDVSGISKGSDPETGMVKYSLILPKERYSFERVLEVKDSLEMEVRRGYNNSPLNQFGINLEVVFSTRIERPNDIGPENNAYQNGRANQANDDERTEALIRIMRSGRPGQLYSTTELASKLTEDGILTSRGIVLDLLNGCTDRVGHNGGKGKSSRYSLKL